MGVKDGVDILLAEEIDDGFESSGGSSGVISALFTAGVVLMSFLALPVQTPGGIMPMLQAMIGTMTGNPAVTTNTGSPQSVVINVMQPSSSFRCPSLQNPANGQVVITCNPSPCTATYSCVTGYVIIGTSTRFCTSSVWTGSAPTCALMTCPILNSPENGTVTRTCVDMSNRVCMVDYDCVEGQEIEGNSIRNCTSGIWDGEDPICGQVGPASS